MQTCGRTGIQPFFNGSISLHKWTYIKFNVHKMLHIVTSHFKKFRLPSSIEYVAFLCKNIYYMLLQKYILHILHHYIMYFTIQHVFYTRNSCMYCMFVKYCPYLYSGALYKETSWTYWVSQKRAHIVLTKSVTTKNAHAAMFKKSWPIL